MNAITLDFGSAGEGPTFVIDHNERNQGLLIDACGHALNYYLPEHVTDHLIDAIDKAVNEDGAS